MASEIQLPELGENLEGGEVLDVKVAVGDTVSAGQPLLEVEAEKSTVEVPSPEAGKVTKLLVKKGDKIKVGQTLCLIEGAGAAKEKSQAAPQPGKSTPEAEPEPSQAPRQKPGPEDPKANAAEVERKLSAPANETHKPKGDGQKKPAPPPSDREPARAPAAPGAEKLVPAGPATRRLARELGVDLHLVTGTAPGGRVSEEDVKAYVRQLSAGGGAVVRGGPAAAQAPPLPDFSKWGPVEAKPLEPVRRRTAEQMSLAWSQIPHVTQHDQADITDLEAFRKQQDGKGPKLTVTAFALKAVAVALKEFPQFNSSLDTAGGQLIYKRYYHVGVAVDTDRGLLVPVLRDVDRKSLRELAQELNDLAERARQKKVPVEELRGGTFTITNLGGIGGTAFTPIVNYPEVAILGLSRSRLQPVVRNGEVVPRLILPLSLSYDHRVIDGADAARFTRRLADMFENPLLML